MYPIPEYVDGSISMFGPAPNYRQLLNQCIDERYRKKGFGITYAIFNKHQISDVVTLWDCDRVIEVGMDFATHTTKLPNGRYPYPDSNFILDQLGNIRVLRIGGFHSADCVEKVARRAYRRGLGTLVDEDLTEFFPALIRQQGFRVDRYPNYNPRQTGPLHFQCFMKARKNKPWLWQNY